MNVNMKMKLLSVLVKLGVVKHPTLMKPILLLYRVS